MNSQDELIRRAEEVADLAEKQGVRLLVIGAAALAGHHYVRMTRDLDLAGNLSARELRALADGLKAEGYDTELRLPDAQDPLSGVIDIQGAFGQIQIISFADTFPAVIRDALEEELVKVRQGSPLTLVPLPHLVVLKLYAGGYKSKADILEVLSRNPEADLDAMEALCRRYRIDGFGEIRRELGR